MGEAFFIMTHDAHPTEHFRSRFLITALLCTTTLHIYFGSHTVSGSQDAHKQAAAHTAPLKLSQLHFLFTKTK